MCFARYEILAFCGGLLYGVRVYTKRILNRVAHRYDLVCKEPTQGEGGVGNHPNSICRDNMRKDRNKQLNRLASIIGVPSFCYFT